MILGGNNGKHNQNIWLKGLGILSSVDTECYCSYSNCCCCIASLWFDMKDKIIFFITLLDFLLILMTVLMILITLHASSLFNLFYNIVYVTLNSVSLLLNIHIINRTRNPS